jgi:long-chain fatty acid transport protein
MVGFARTLSLAAVSAAALAAGHTAAVAGAFGLREQSATAQGMSFAGAASGSGGIASMFWNPAAVTMKPGWNKDFNASVVIPEARISTQPGTFPALPALGNSGDIGQTAVLPATYTSYQLNDRVWVGLAGAAPFGLITKPNQVWAGQVYGRSSKVFTLNFNPVVGIKVTDWLSIAAGPVLEYFKATLKQATGISPLSPSAYLRGDDWGFGYTAGVMITPFAGTQFGVGYRSSIHHDLEGPVFGVGRGIVPINTPEKVSVGLTQAIGPNFRLNLGFEWDNWSRIGKVPVISQALGRPVSVLPFDYKDGFYYSIGGEYDWSERLTLRAGFAYEDSPIDVSNRSVRLPDADRYWLSVGGTYRWSEKLAFNLAYSHLFIDKAPIRVVPGNPLYIAPLAYVAEARGNVNIVSVGATYRWDDPKVAIPAPIVRKY